MHFCSGLYSSLRFTATKLQAGATGTGFAFGQLKLWDKDNNEITDLASKVKDASCSSAWGSRTGHTIYKSDDWFFSGENSFENRLPKRAGGEWVQIDFHNPVSLNKFHLQHREPKYNPTDWKLEGKSGNVWQTLYEAKGETISGLNVDKTYTIGNIYISLNVHTFLCV